MTEIIATVWFEDLRVSRPTQAVALLDVIFDRENLTKDVTTNERMTISTVLGFSGLL